MLTLADAILQEDISSIKSILQFGESINQIDEYGFTPLIEAAIVNNIKITELLLDLGAEPNLPDVTGGTPLQWAAENNNMPLCELLLKHHANPNAYNFAGQPVVVMPMLRRQTDLKKMLIRHGADETFAKDFINAKVLGHLFELVGTISIVNPQNKLVEVDLEGFYLETTLGLIADSLLQFRNHFAARKLRPYMGFANQIVQILDRAARLIQYQQYSVDRKKYASQIDALISEEPLLIPVGYEGHAIAFIKYHDILVKCDRREDSRLFDNIVFYRIRNIENANHDFIKSLIYTKQTDNSINHELPTQLNLQPLTQLKIPAQISGNCSWANIEGCIPALFFLLIRVEFAEQEDSYYKTLALQFFDAWRGFSKTRALQYCIDSFQEADPIRKASKAEILAAILFQSLDVNKRSDQDALEKILVLLADSPYRYLLDNYVRVYHYEKYTEEGKRFAALMKKYGYLNT